MYVYVFIYIICMLRINDTDFSFCFSVFHDIISHSLKFCSLTAWVGTLHQGDFWHSKPLDTEMFVDSEAVDQGLIHRITLP